ncbi:hypothetical protein HDU97_002173 [Phlyctochytrium planicorne]|nr:hypothetical protein HDU97_002173 [Phlyctochytrium planicorne]
MVQYIPISQYASSMPAVGQHGHGYFSTPFSGYQTPTYSGYSASPYEGYTPIVVTTAPNMVYQQSQVFQSYGGPSAASNVYQTSSAGSVGMELDELLLSTTTVPHLNTTSSAPQHVDSSSNTTNGSSTSQTPILTTLTTPSTPQPLNPSTSTSPHLSIIPVDASKLFMLKSMGIASVKPQSGISSNPSDPKLPTYALSNQIQSETLETGTGQEQIQAISLRPLPSIPFALSTQPLILAGDQGGEMSFVPIIVPTEEIGSLGVRSAGNPEEGKKEDVREISEPIAVTKISKPDTGKVVYLCAEMGCSREFVNKNALKKHMLSHSASSSSSSSTPSVQSSTSRKREKRRHVCPLCFKTFARIHDLNRHDRTKHSDERPHKCPNCPATFPRADSLKKHMECEAKGTAKGFAYYSALAERQNRLKEEGKKDEESGSDDERGDGVEGGEGGEEGDEGDEEDLAPIPDMQF